MPNTLRTDFHDDAFWKPCLTTDKAGRLAFEVTYPDDITSWDANFIAVGGRRQTDRKQLRIKSYKPLNAQLSVPRFAIAGDSLNAAGRLTNHTGDTLSVRRTMNRRTDSRGANTHRHLAYGRNTRRRRGCRQHPDRLLADDARRLFRRGAACDPDLQGRNPGNPRGVRRPQRHRGPAVHARPGAGHRDDPRRGIGHAGIPRRDRKHRPLPPPLQRADGFEGQGSALEKTDIQPVRTKIQGRRQGHEPAAQTDGQPKRRQVMGVVEPGTDRTVDLTAGRGGIARRRNGGL